MSGRKCISSCLYHCHFCQLEEAREMLAELCYGGNTSSQPGGIFRVSTTKRMIIEHPQRQAWDLQHDKIYNQLSALDHTFRW
jgi:hypothetical protein